MALADTADAQQKRADMYGANPFQIGLFGANLSSGRTATTVPERWSGDWLDCLEMAKIADDGGIDFLLPVGRWKGYGGASDFHGGGLETITWATGLLAHTKRVTVFGTVHAPLFHPLVAAKQMVTADQVGGGRFGLNIVAGWNQDEFEMFGIEQRPHDERYVFAEEWLDVMMKAWTCPEPFDYDGKYFQLRKVLAKPKPFGHSRPLIMNAGASGAGQTFAMRNCDAFFTTITNAGAGYLPKAPPYVQTSQSNFLTANMTPVLTAVAATLALNPGGGLVQVCVRRGGRDRRVGGVGEGVQGGG